MSRIIEVCIPKYPECWSSCGNCGSGEVSIDDVLVLPGDAVARDDTLIVLETGKVAIDIPAPRAGKIVELFVAAGDLVGEGQLIATLEIGEG
ncbi:MAG: pyruvate/2-oxoglutarate dehydrogenase complex, dihydrolipoamide acyltransferase component [Proteobacteria bacterium]|nr:pyruvate/2-oxoglutarate dehydrogenase complex, dihydrolipoamide acyltransferase component [Pseudomonadota bacterium]